MGNKFVGSEDVTLLTGGSQSGTTSQYTDWFELDHACNEVEIAYAADLGGSSQVLNLWLEFDFGGSQTNYFNDGVSATGATSVSGTWRENVSGYPGGRRVRLGRSCGAGHSASNIEVTLRETRSGR